MWGLLGIMYIVGGEIIDVLEISVLTVPGVSSRSVRRSIPRLIRWSIEGLCLLWGANRKNERELGNWRKT